MFFKRGRFDRFTHVPSFFESSTQIDTDTSTKKGKKRKEQPTKLFSPSKYSKLMLDEVESSESNKRKRKRKEPPTKLFSPSKYSKLMLDEIEISGNTGKRKRKIVDKDELPNKRIKVGNNELPGKIVSGGVKRKTDSTNFLPSKHAKIEEKEKLDGIVISATEKRKSDPTAILLPSSHLVEVEPNKELGLNKMRLIQGNKIQKKRPIKLREIMTNVKNLAGAKKFVITNTNISANKNKKKQTTQEEKPEPDIAQLLKEIENKETILRKLINHQKARDNKQNKVKQSSKSKTPGTSERALKIQATKKNKAEIARKLLNHQKAKAAREEREREAQKLVEVSDILLS